MGHASITVTFDRYAHLMSGNEEEVANLLTAYLECCHIITALAGVDR